MYAAYCWVSCLASSRVSHVCCGGSGFRGAGCQYAPLNIGGLARRIWKQSSDSTPSLQLSMGHRDQRLLMSRYINLRGITRSYAAAFWKMQL